MNSVALVFLDNSDEILKGNFNSSLIDSVDVAKESLAEVQDISVKRIYGHDTVVQVEIAGFNVMSELLDLFVPALLKSSPSHKEEKILYLFPYQYTGFRESSSSYEKVMNALDHLSSMTDEYATEMYRRLKGIVIPRHG